MVLDADYFTTITLLSASPDEKSLKRIEAIGYLALSELRANDIDEFDPDSSYKAFRLIRKVGADRQSELTIQLLQHREDAKQPKVQVTIEFLDA